MDFANKPYSVIRTDSLSEENSLAHYGVKGMKWGVRRDIARRSKMGYRAGRYAEGYGKRADRLTRRQEKWGYSDRRAKKIDSMRSAQKYLKNAQKKLYKDLSDADIKQGARAVKRSNVLKTAALLMTAPGGVVGGLVYGGHRVYQENKIDRMTRNR